MTNNFQPVVQKSKKRVGRGVGSGKGFHTTGRGQKGQKARYTVGPLFEGVKTKKSMLHRLPMLPGKGKFKAKAKPVAISLVTLERLPAGEISVARLIEYKVMRKKDTARGAKIVGNTAVTKKFSLLKVAASKGASDAILAAGGTIA